MSTPCPTPPDVPLESKLSFLREASSYPDAAGRIESIETHMSWVFLAGACAYKLKKPVHYGTLDFTTPDARHFYCEEEVRLNRRLAREVYLGTLPLGIDSHGHLHLGDGATAIDWLVQMRRLPGARMLDHAIRCRTATSADMRRIAAMLAAFYRAGPPLRPEPASWRARLRRETEETAAALRTAAYRLPRLPVDEVERRLLEQLQRHPDRFDRRIAEGRIVEGHGDLRPEHVYLGKPLAIIDCLEFSRELRVLDAADELGFLALECERFGAARLGLLLLRHYRMLSGDTPEPALLHFYQAFRALLRARIAIRHLDEARFRYSPEWPRRTLCYLRLAQLHARRCSRG